MPARSGCVRPPLQRMPTPSELRQVAAATRGGIAQTSRDRRRNACPPLLSFAGSPLQRMPALPGQVWSVAATRDQAIQACRGAAATCSQCLSDLSGSRRNVFAVPFGLVGKPPQGFAVPSRLVGEPPQRVGGVFQACPGAAATCRRCRPGLSGSRRNVSAVSSRRVREPPQRVTHAVLLVGERLQRVGGAFRACQRTATARGDVAQTCLAGRVRRCAAGRQTSRRLARFFCSLPLRGDARGKPCGFSSRALHSLLPSWGRDFAPFSPQPPLPRPEEGGVDAVPFFCGGAVSPAGALGGPSGGAGPEGRCVRPGVRCVRPGAWRERSGACCRAPPAPLRLRRGDGGEAHHRRPAGNIPAHRQGKRCARRKPFGVFASHPPGVGPRAVAVDRPGRHRQHAATAPRQVRTALRTRCGGSPTSQDGLGVRCGGEPAKSGWGGHALWR